MSKVITAAFFNDGTASVGEDVTPNNFVGKLFYKATFDVGNIVWDIFKHTVANEDVHEHSVKNKLQYKFYFPGPGTDICYSSGFTSYLNTVGGWIYGGIGSNSVDNTVKKIVDHILDIKQKAELEGDLDYKIEIVMVGWSRGGYVNWLLKKELAELNINLAPINIAYIDPVVGGPFDRANLYLNSGRKDPEVPINSLIIYSENGNAHAINGWPFRFNTPFFSAFDPVDNDKENAEKFQVEADHEETNNKWNSVYGKIVRLHILEWLTKHTSLSFEKEWVETVAIEGREAEAALENRRRKEIEEIAAAEATQLAKTKKNTPCNRAVLRASGITFCFVGERNLNHPNLVEERARKAANNAIRETVEIVAARTTVAVVGNQSKSIGKSVANDVLPILPCKLF